MLEVDVPYNPEIPLPEIYPKYRTPPTATHKTIYTGIHNGQKNENNSKVHQPVNR